MAKNIKKALAMSLVVCMLLSALPMQALAAEESVTTETIVDGGLTTTITTVTGTAEDDSSATVVVKIEEVTGTDAAGATVNSEKTTTTVTAADGSVTETIVNNGSSTEERTEEIDTETAELPDVAVPLVPGETSSGQATGDPEIVPVDNVPGGSTPDNTNITTTTTTTTSQVTVTTSETEVTEGDNHGTMVDTNGSLHPDQYEGKQEVWGGVYPDNIMTSGGYENQWSFAVSLGYIIEEIGEDGNPTGRYVLDAEKMTTSSPGSKPTIEGETPEYLLVGSGEWITSTKFMISNVNYEYVTDEYGNKVVKTDENGDPVYSLSNLGGQATAPMILWGTDGKPYYAYAVCSEDEAAVTSLITGYVVEELSESEKFKDDPETQEHIRGIALHGYWGSNPGSTGSLQNLKDEMKAAVLGGLDISLKGSADQEAILAAIDGLTEGDALAATQAALLAYSYGTEADIDGTQSSIISGTFSGDSNGYTKLIYDYLLTVTEKDDRELAAIDETSMNLIVGDKVGEKTDENGTAGVYDVALNFTLTIVPGKNDKLNVVLQYVDADGVPQTVIKALGSENSDETVAPNADGSYTLTGLKLSENSDTSFDLRLEGTQYLENGVCVYSSTHKNSGSDYYYFGEKDAPFHSLVGVNEVGVAIDTGVAFSVNFSVDASNQVVVSTEWHSETVEEKEGTTVGTKNEDGVAVVTLYNPGDNNRLANNTTDIPEEPVPLASPAVTGDNTGLWIVGFLMVAMGMVAINLFDKKRQQESV